jgi:hypothetical protein
MKMPTLRLIHTPTKRLGRRYSDARSMEWFWISWKLKVRQRLPYAFLTYFTYYKLEKITIEFIAPYDKATSEHVLANWRFFHSALGTRAGRPLRSQYRIQRGNAMSSTRLITSSEAVFAVRMMDRSALVILYQVSIR